MFETTNQKYHQIPQKISVHQLIHPDAPFKLPRPHYRSPFSRHIRWKYGDRTTTLRCKRHFLRHPAAPRACRVRSEKWPVDCEMAGIEALGGQNFAEPLGFIWF